VTVVLVAEDLVALVLAALDLVVEPVEMELVVLVMVASELEVSVH